MTTSAYTQSSFDWQGHRGCRGIMPENTIPAFKKALELGVTTLELDVVISKDKQVVVSHEPFFSPEICQDAAGKPVSKEQSPSYSLYQLTYAEIQSFDCGSRGNSRFPDQQKMVVHKPLLSEVLQMTLQYCREKSIPLVQFNIEIKSTPAGDDVLHPSVPEFSALVYQVVKEYIPLEHLILQSFDFRTLQYWHEHYPAVRLAALVENAKSVSANIQDLGFTPQIYSPYYKLLSGKEAVRKIHAAGMKVIPWTINEVKDMRKVKSWGVDGIITDYPNRIADVGK